MGNHIQLYPWSLSEAKKHDEIELWRESYKENCKCANEIESAINENYKDNCLNTDTAKEIIKKYGFERVNFVLANTISQHKNDGRFSEQNKEWASRIYIPKDDICWHYSVEAHPGLVDLYINRVRKEFESLGLFSQKECNDESNYVGKVLALKPSTLKDEYKTRDFQLFFATGGFGCDPTKLGRKVFGYFIKDGEYAEFVRTNFLGAVKDEHIPDWVHEKLSAPEPDLGMKGME